MRDFQKKMKDNKRVILYVTSFMVPTISCVIFPMFCSFMFSCFLAREKEKDFKGQISQIRPILFAVDKILCVRRYIKKQRRAKNASNVRSFSLM